MGRGLRARLRAAQDESRPKQIGFTFLGLFGLSGLAVAQPVFDVASRSPTFLVAHGISGGKQIVFALALILIPPVVATAVIASVSAISPKAGRVACAVIVGILFAVVLSPTMTRALASLPTLATLLFAAFAVVGAVGYARSTLAQRYLRWLAPAPLLFAAWFLAFGPATIFAPTVDPEDRGGAGKHPSLVHVVLDEFSLGSLLLPDGSIDAERFPNFARLANTSTWYPDATTNANATRLAVPTSLTGRFPSTATGIPPSESVYPDNLFSLLDPTHELRISETVTGMCSARRCRSTALPFGEIKHFIADTALVYLHRVSPPALKARLPFLPERQWAGFFADPLLIPRRVADVPRPLRPVARSLLTRLADTDAHPYSVEVRRFDAFVRSIERPSGPTVWFHHGLLPHHPWHLTHDGRPFDDQHLNGFVAGAFASTRDADEALQLYLLQLKATDRMIGELIDRLVSEGLWDRTMVVIHSDHGVTFRQNTFFRSIEKAPDEVLAIPLFIRYPGQRRGRIDRTNVEIVDILPTISDVMDIPARWALDGVSLLGTERRSQKRAWAGKEPAEALPPYDSIDPTSPTQRIRSLFGSMRRSDDLYAWGPHRRLAGRSIPRRISEQCPSSVTLERPERFASFDPDGPFVPARVSGVVGAQTSLDWLAVAVNGRVAGFGRPFPAGASDRFSIVMSPRYFDPGPNVVEVYGIDDDHVLTCV